MPELRINEQNQLVDADGNLVNVDGEPVTVLGAKRQEDVDAAFQREKAKSQDKIRTLNDRIKSLETQTSRTAEVEALLDALRSEKTDLEKKLQDAEAAAESKVAAQLKAARDGHEKLKSELEAERAARVRDQVSTAILSAAKDRFTDPGIDVLPHLLSVHFREPRKDERGNTVDGEFQDFFKVSYTNEQGEMVTENLPADKALDVWAAEHPHHVKPSNRGGSGGGHYGFLPSNLKRSTMTVEDKVAFIGKHGQEAYQSLPD